MLRGIDRVLRHHPSRTSKHRGSPNGDLAEFRGIRFTVDESFVAVEVRMDGRAAGTYNFTAELRRSTGFTAPVEASSPVSVVLPGTHNVTPYPVVHIDFQKRELPVGPPLAMKIARDDLVAQMEQGGFELAAEHELLPYQYFLVFE